MPAGSAAVGSAWNTAGAVGVVPTCGDQSALVEFVDAASSFFITDAPVYGQAWTDMSFLETNTSVNGFGVSLDASAPFKLVSGAVVLSDYLGDGLPDILCDHFPNLCGAMSIDYTAPIDPDRAYWVLDGYIGSMGITGPGGVDLGEVAQIGTTLPVIVWDPAELMTYIFVPDQLLAGGVVEGLAVGSSSCGNLPHHSRLEVPTINNKFDAKLATATVHGHVHQATHITTKLKEVPVDFFGAITVDLDPNDDGMLGGNGYKALLGQTVDPPAKANKRDFAMLFDGQALLNLDLGMDDGVCDAMASSPLCWAIKLPLAEASVLFVNTDAPASLSKNDVLQSGLHFAGKFGSPDGSVLLDDVIPESLQQYAEFGGQTSWVRGVFVDPNRWWLEITGTTVAVAGLNSQDVVLTYSPGEVSLVGTFEVAVLGSVGMSGTLDPTNGDVTLCTDGNVTIPAAILGVDVDAQACFERKGGKLTWTFDYDLDASFSTKDGASEVTAWLTYSKSKTSCEECSATEFWNCLDEIPGVGDSLQDLVDAACTFGGAVIKEVKGNLVKVVKAISGTITFEFDLSVTGVAQLGFDADGGFSPDASFDVDIEGGVEFTVSGLGSIDKSIDIGNASVSSKGEVSFQVGGVKGVTFCVDVLRGKCQ